MVTYEYQCEACGMVFEQRQPITAPPLDECPECGGNVSRLISGGAGFIFKKSGGSGLRTDSGACSFAESGRTCCGRREPCGQPSCGEER